MSAIISFNVLNLKRNIKTVIIINGNRSSRPKVISPEVMSPGTRVMLPEIHSHVTRNFIECLILKKSNNRKK